MNGNHVPEPWLNGRHPVTAEEASWVEYLRWMRVTPEDKTVKSGTILQLFKQFERGDLSKHLNRLSDRTQRIADMSFQVTCPWRIRVGGIRGPEEILLPAFDALGMPYIPSSTLRGVARAIATRQIGSAEVDRIFGNINPESSSMGQVIFLDAYPVVTENDDLGGIQLDMANQIWKWEGTQPPEYNTNPNVLVSLERPTFIIGVRRGVGCSQETCDRVLNWLKSGLVEGIGSRVNTGYGKLESDVQQKSEWHLLRIPFELKGQLIHGYQTFREWNQNNQGNWDFGGRAVAELRPTAFRSMLRYWFRALALGVLPSETVRDLELDLFGGIEPDPHTGVFRVEVRGEIKQQLSRESPGLATGFLEFRQCPHADRQISDRTLKLFLQSVTWLMFHLGGIGLGARRPCYSRQNRPTPPYWRGSTLISTSTHDFWHRPGNPAEFQSRFVKRMQQFYRVLAELSKADIDPRNPLAVLPDSPTATTWAEAIDRQCEIVCVSGKTANHKPFALAQLHQLANQGNGHYNSALCGNSNKTPSPIWIAQVEDYQVVTVFGAQEENRSEYLNILDNFAQNFYTLWPLPRKSSSDRG